MSKPDVSIIVCTYNRPQLLRRLLDSVLAQTAPDFLFELLVVDNNSTPETRNVIEEVSSYDSRVEYLHEPRQGNAYARNTGVVAARAPIIAFLDDDVTVVGNWLSTIRNAFQKNDIDFIGGKVLPRWEHKPPSWLTHPHWAPIAAVDYGNRPFTIDSQNPLCLLTANLAIRTKIFNRFGGFSASVQRAGDSIGSLEDHEFIIRLIRGGVRGLYIPDLVVEAHVGSERLTKTYHRRWHTGHGHFYALMRDPEWERSKFRLMGVPSHLYKDTATHAVIWFSKVLRGADTAFIHECHLRFFRGFFLARQRERLAPDRLGSERQGSEHSE